MKNKSACTLSNTFKKPFSHLQTLTLGMSIIIILGFDGIMLWNSFSTFGSGAFRKVDETMKEDYLHLKRYLSLTLCQKLAHGFQKCLADVQLPLIFNQILVSGVVIYLTQCKYF